MDEGISRSKMAVASLVIMLVPPASGIMAILSDACNNTTAFGVFVTTGFVSVLIGTPVSAILAVLSLRRISRSRGSLVGKKTAISALVLAVLGAAFIAWAIPSFIDARDDSRRGGCWCVLACIDSAKEQLALEDGMKDGDAAPLEKVILYIKGGTNHFVCPSVHSNTYTIGDIGESPRCSFHGSLQELRDRSARGEFR